MCCLHRIFSMTICDRVVPEHHKSSGRVVILTRYFGKEDSEACVLAIRMPTDWIEIDITDIKFVFIYFYSDLDLNLNSINYNV